MGTEASLKPVLQGTKPPQYRSYRVYTQDALLSAHYSFAGSLIQDRMDLAESVTPARGLSPSMLVSLTTQGTAWTASTRGGHIETLARDHGSRWILGYGGSGHGANVGVRLTTGPELGIDIVISAARWEQPGSFSPATMTACSGATSSCFPNGGAHVTRGDSAFDRGNEALPGSRRAGWSIVGGPSTYLRHIGDYVAAHFYVIIPRSTTAPRARVRAAWFYSPYYAWGRGYTFRQHTDTFMWTLNPERSVPGPALFPTRSLARPNSSDQIACRGKRAGSRVRVPGLGDTVGHPHQ
jgi:hypothetical protein